MEARILVVDDALDSWNVLSSMLHTHRYQPIEQLAASKP